MTTLSHVSRASTNVSEMTDLIGPGPEEPRSGTEQRPKGPTAAVSSPGRADPSRPIDPRQRKRWVPRLAGWIVLVVGVCFITAGVNADLYQRIHHIHSRLHKVVVTTPGALTLTLTLTRTALIVVGLLLLMLC